MSYAEFFLGSTSDTVQLETFEISHSAFSKVYFVVRNSTSGLTATLEDGRDVFFEYYPLRIRQSGVRDDLDFGMSVDLGDLGEILPEEMERVRQADKFAEKPQSIYRAYSSADLSTPLFGPLLLEIKRLNTAKEGASFEAQAPSINVNTTGEIYHLDRFPTLISFI